MTKHEINLLEKARTVIYDYYKLKEYQGGVPSYVNKRVMIIVGQLDELLELETGEVEL